MGRLKHAEYWRKCAKETRIRTNRLNEPEARRKLPGTAETYDWLAENVEKREAERRPVWELAR